MPDLLKERFPSSGEKMLEFLGFRSHQTYVDKILALDWRLQTALLLLFTMLLGFGIMVFAANVIPVPEPIKKASQAVTKPGAPPLQPDTEVVSLRVYPIKSCRGFEVTSTRLRKAGLSLDRNWMFITTSDKKFCTIRGDASMTLIDTKITDDEKTKEQMLEISIHGTDGRVVIPAFPSKKWLEANTTLQTVEIWEKETDGYVYGDSVNKIFCDYFNKPVALVYKGPTDRMVAVNGSKEMYGREVAHHFADVMSLQVANESSIKDLARRLKEKHGGDWEDFTIERFRPNIIVKGRKNQPWEEDNWKRVRITTNLPDEQALYKIDLDAVARCARCQVPNVNPDTAEKSEDNEPWNELMKFRRVDLGDVAKWKPCFGMLCIPKNEGKIQVGAKFEVLETTSNHSFNTRKFADL